MKLDSNAGTLYEGSRLVAVCQPIGGPSPRTHSQECADGETIARAVSACHGLDLPASAPAGILAELVEVARGTVDALEGTESEGATLLLGLILSKLNPAPVSTEPRGMHFTSCGYLSIRTPDGSRRDYRGTTREEHERHAAEIRETIARQTRSLETLQTYLDGGTEESPAALQQRADV